jgi:HEAT repeat protein
VPQIAQRFEESGRIGLPPHARTLANGLVTRSERALYESALDDLAAADPGTRRRAAERLRVLGARSASPLVAAAVGREPDASAKAALLGALGALAEPGAADLAARELSDPRPLVRAAALDALYALSRDAAIPQLAGALRDPTPLVRRRAALLLGFCHGPDADDALAPVLADRDPGVARAAAAALAGRPNRRAQGALARAIANPRAEVRRSAERAVGRWAGEPLRGDLDESDRRALARKMTERLREIDGAALRGAVSRVPAQTVKAKAAAAIRGAGAPAAAAAAPAPAVDVARAVLAEVRAALRGRTTAEIADSIAAAPGAVDGAIRALAAQGAVVARGARFYAA